ncbi:MAG: HEAT repeat domain-containing protein, partial [Thermodesulfobacteriota bacterium]
HILSVLGRIGDPSALKHFGNLIIHKDPKVRGQTLQVISKFGEKGMDLVQKFLTDSMAEIRGNASLILARTAKGRASKLLLEIVLSEDFYQRDYEEKASFFRALGETGSEEVIPMLKKIAKKRSWFQKGRWDEMRQCAANTLKMMGAK